MSLSSHATKMLLLTIGPAGVIDTISLNVTGTPASAELTTNHRAHAPPA